MKKFLGIIGFCVFLLTFYQHSSFMIGADRGGEPLSTITIAADLGGDPLSQTKTPV